MLPFDVSTEHTFEFVTRSMPEGRLRLLEVGCGRGDLALRLRGEGHEIVGVEHSADEAEAARARGLDVRTADFVTFRDEPFDAVLFTRSLHHIPELTEAVARSASLLKPGGLLVAEEFDVEHVDRETAAWFYRVEALLVAAKAIPEGHDAGASDPLARWELDHREHGLLHAGAALIAAVAGRFELAPVDRPCYLFRHFCRRLRESPECHPLARRLLAAEERLVQRGAVLPLGLRLVAKKRSPA